MGLSRDRGDRPRLIGRGRERRDDRRDRRDDRRDDRGDRRDDRQDRRPRTRTAGAIAPRQDAFRVNRTRSTERVDPLDDRVDPSHEGRPRSDQAHENRSVGPEAVSPPHLGHLQPNATQVPSAIPTYTLGTSTNLRDHQRRWAK
jgi:hypothetical protein